MTAGRRKKKVKKIPELEKKSEREPSYKSRSFIMGASKMPRRGREIGSMKKMYIKG